MGPNNICKQVLISETLNNIKGLGYECKLICNELGLRNIFLNNFKKFEIANAIDCRIKSETLDNMLACKKVADRVDNFPEANNYLKSLPLSSARIWFRYRARAIKGVKYNTKSSNLNDLSCRFCQKTEAVESQEHLEICEGNENERRKLPNMSSDWSQLLRFWIRLSKKLSTFKTKEQTNTVIDKNHVISNDSSSSNNTVKSSSSSDSSTESLAPLASCDFPILNAIEQDC